MTSKRNRVECHLDFDSLWHRGELTWIEVSADTNSVVTVDFATTDLTALSGLDYAGATNTLTFASGERVKVVPIPILNDGITEPTRTFRLTLSHPTGGGVLGPRSTVTVSIQDNEAWQESSFPSFASVEWVLPGGRAKAET